jgi:hypothetical protein
VYNHRKGGSMTENKYPAIRVKKGTHDKLKYIAQFERIGSLAGMIEMFVHRWNFTHNNLLDYTLAGTTETEKEKHE